MSYHVDLKLEAHQIISETMLWNEFRREVLGPEFYREVEKVKQILSVNKKPEIVGYNVDGSPVTQKQLVKRAKVASKRVKSGDFISQEDVEKEVENW
jgi:hypothetical protein